MDVIAKKSKVKRHCRVLYDYCQQHGDELSLNVDDIIEIITEVEEGWWQGKLNGKIGVFPSNFVVEIDLIHPKICISDNPVIPPVANNNCNNNNNTDELPISCSMPVMSPVTNQKAGKTMCMVKYSYTAKNDDELSLKEGDIITLISKETQDKGWGLGELNGKTGVFPDNFVTLINFDQNLTFRRDVSISPKNNVAAHRKSLEVISSSTKNNNCNNDTKNAPILQKSENDLDQIERNNLLTDLRVSRAKAPKRRPPSLSIKDLIVLNDKDDHRQKSVNSYENVYDEILGTNQDVLETSKSVDFVLNSNNHETELITKNQVKEWEKHKAPWIDELKLNQKVKKILSPPNVIPIHSSDNDMSTTTTNNEIDSPLKKSPTPLKPIKSSRSITPTNHNNNNNDDTNNISKLCNDHLDEDNSKIVLIEKSKLDDLINRVLILENSTTDQFRELHITIEELKAKLEIEKDLRNLLQVQFDKLIHATKIKHI